jgi:hypothetical protein
LPGQAAGRLLEEFESTVVEERVVISSNPARPWQNVGESI